MDAKICDKANLYELKLLILIKYKEAGGCTFEIRSYQEEENGQHEENELRHSQAEKADQQSEGEIGKTCRTKQRQ